VDTGVGAKVNTAYGLKGQIATKMWNFHWFDTGKHVFQIIAANVAAEKVHLIGITVYPKKEDGSVDVENKTVSSGFHLIGKNRLN